MAATSNRPPRNWLAKTHALFAAVLLGCNSSPSLAPPAPRGPAWFEEAASDVGLSFVNQPGPPGSYFMPQDMGNGSALLDYDQDGRLDIYLLNGAVSGSPTTNRLFHQEPDGSFREVTQGSGLDIAGWCCGVAIGDVSNDGFPDVFLSEYGGLKLLLNTGQGTFRDVTSDSGLANLRWGVSSGFLDFDRDGWLDLVVVNYIDLDPQRLCYASDGSRDFCGPIEFDGSPTLLFRNATRADSPQPRFTDVSASSGLAAVPGPGLGVLCADFNSDGWDDIFVANDMQHNRLWINQHDQTFADEAVSRGVAVNGLGAAAANMGTAWGDVDDDGLADLFVTHLDYESHTIWKQGPPGLFLDRTAQAGLMQAPRTTGFGTVLADFDLDGDLDLAYVNGHVFRGQAVESSDVPEFWRPYAQRNSLWENNGGRFTSIAADNDAFCGAANVGRSLACGDIDNDGDLDLLSAPTAGQVQLLRNVVPRRGHWLLVRATDPELRRDAYGAIVTVTAVKRRWQRLINPASSYLSSHDSRAHFGLGDATQFDSLTVRWPGGESESFAGGTADRSIELRRGEGRRP